MFDAVKKLDTSLEHVAALSQRSSGRFVGNNCQPPWPHDNGTAQALVGLKPIIALYRRRELLEQKILPNLMEFEIHNQPPR